jgi:hypothetical protein
MVFNLNRINFILCIVETARRGVSTESNFYEYFSVVDI